MTERELDDLLFQWKRWCYWHDEAIGPEPFKLGSAERFWRSPQCWEAPEPRQDEPKDWIGLGVERAVQKLPERPRAVLRMEYLGVATYQGRRKLAFREHGQSKEQLQERKRRALHLSVRDYEQGLYDARIMLRNLLKAVVV